MTFSLKKFFIGATILFATANGITQTNASQIAKEASEKLVKSSEVTAKNAAALVEKIKKEQEIKKDQWENTKNWIKRGFSGSCTKTCAENSNLCKDQQAKSFCKSKCDGKYRMPGKNDFFSLKKRCGEK